MKEFDNYDDLFDFLDESLDNSLEDLAKVFKETLYNFVKEKFYDIYDPKYYERTWEVLNSITISPKYKEGNMTTVDVFFDINKIHPRISTFSLPKGMRRLNHHLGFNGNPANDIIIFLLNEGWRIPNGQKRQGGKFLQAMRLWAENKNNWINELRELLKLKGVDIDGGIV